MDKIRKVLLLLLVYALIFWIGFRIGEINNRVKRGFQVRDPEAIVVNDSRTQDYYYLVEDMDYGTYKYTNISEVAGNNAIIKFLYNEKLKPLLKKKNLKIYSASGEELY